MPLPLPAAEPEQLFATSASIPSPLTLLAVQFPFIALAIWLDSRGPILFRQVRMGRGGALFTLYVFNAQLDIYSFVGLILLQSSFTGFCPLAVLLKKLGVQSGPAF